MGTSKTDLFTNDQNEMSLILKALAHPARIAILEYLMKVDKCICGDIVNELPLAQPTISQHLKEMKSVGLIKGNVEGTSICYCINKETIERLQLYFSGVASQLTSKDSQCC